MSFTTFVGKQALYFSMIHVTVLFDEFFKNTETLFKRRVCYHSSRCCCRILVVPLPRWFPHASGPLHGDPGGWAARDGAHTHWLPALRLLQRRRWQVRQNDVVCHTLTLFCSAISTIMLNFVLYYNVSSIILVNICCVFNVWWL